MEELAVVRHVILIGRLVENHVDARKRPLDGRAVPDVAVEELDGPLEIRGRAARMDARLEIVQHAHLIATIEQCIRNVGADEPSPARH